MTEKSIILNAEINGLYNPDEAYVVSGPQQGELPSSFIVLHHKDIEPLLNGLKAMGHETTEDFTATRINCAFKISHKNIVHDNELLKPIGSEFLTGLGPDFTGVAEGPQSLIAKTLMIDGHRIALSKSPYATPVTNPTVGEDGVESGDNEVLYPDGRIKETFTVGSTLFTHGNPTKAPVVPESGRKLYGPNDKPLDLWESGVLPMSPDQPVTVIFRKEPVDPITIGVITDALSAQINRLATLVGENAVYPEPDENSQDALKRRDLHRAKACLVAFTEGRGDPILNEPDNSLYDGVLPPPKAYTINGVEQTPIFTIVVVMALNKKLNDTANPATAVEMITLVRKHLPEPGDGTPEQASAMTLLLFPEFAKK